MDSVIGDMYRRSALVRVAPVRVQVHGRLDVSPVDEVYFPVGSSETKEVRETSMGSFGTETGARTRRTTN